MKTMIVSAVMIAASFGAFATPADAEYCNSLDPAVDRRACMKEQKNARADFSVQAANAAADAALKANRTKRCEPLPDSDKRSCMKRVEQGITSGSVQRGGTITEHREIVIGQ